MLVRHWLQIPSGASRPLPASALLRHGGSRLYHATSLSLVATSQRNKKRRRKKSAPANPSTVSSPPSPPSPPAASAAPNTKATKKAAGLAPSPVFSHCPTQSPSPAPAAPLHPFRLGTIQEREKALLGYFGRARHHYDVVPLHKATAALQFASHQQASRVPMATLFPSPRPAASASTTTAPAEVGLPSTSPPSASLALSSAAFAAPQLFVGYDHKLNQFSDWAMSRLLSNRLSSHIDHEKQFGCRDVFWGDIVTDVDALWESLGAAWEAALAHCAASGAGSKLPQHQSVCFAVFFAHTCQTLSVATSMHAIAHGLARQCRASADTAAEVFTVVPVFVGIPACSSAGDSTGGDGSNLTYASGGVYTCAATVQCLSRLPPHQHRSPTRDGHTGGSREYTLRSETFLVSDSWLHARSIADQYGVAATSSDSGGSGRGAAAEASSQLLRESETPTPDSLTGVLERHGAGAVPTLVPEMSRRRVHVFPGVVSDRLSAKERSAFAAYLWSTMRRVGECEGDGTRRTAHTGGVVKAKELDLAERFGV